jgi:hypothetical protein
MTMKMLPPNLQAICEGQRTDLTPEQRSAYDSICRQYLEPAIDPPPNPTQPSLMIRGWNFAAAMARWTLAGMPRRTQAEIDERLAICQACPHLHNNHCTKCGCACVEQNRLVNKLALATEKCPEGKWT